MKATAKKIPKPKYTLNSSFIYQIIKYDPKLSVSKALPSLSQIAHIFLYDTIQVTIL